MKTSKPRPATPVTPAKPRYIMIGGFLGAGKTTAVSRLAIYLKQIEEADLVVISKCDLLDERGLEVLRQALASRFPRKEILAVSAREGTNLEGWFARLTSAGQVARTAMEVDYQVYAAGEAMLGWLNCTVQLTAPQGFDADQFLKRLAGEVQQRLQARRAEVAHLKMSLARGSDPASGVALVNLVRNDFVPEPSLTLTGALSGAHLNPAVTVSLAVWSAFPLRRVAPYVAAQLLGAFVAAGVLYFIFGDALAVFERANDLVRGQPGSEASAMVFGEFFPNPGGQPLTAEARARMSPSAAFAAEVIGTAILLLVICCVTDERNTARPQFLTAAVIGLTVTLSISLLGPLTMACFNPARDLAPRLFSCLAGWGGLPFTVNGHGWVTVYVLAPLLGGVAGGGLYRTCFKRAYAV